MTDDKIAAAMEQGRAQLASIRELVAALASDDEKLVEAARDDIHADALAVEVRADWYTVNAAKPDRKPIEYAILLCTGGPACPACRIRGRLTEHCEPDTAEIEVQDWGTPWTRMWVSHNDELALLEYARQFYFGE